MTLKVTRRDFVKGSAAAFALAAAGVGSSALVGCAPAEEPAEETPAEEPAEETEAAATEEAAEEAPAEEEVDNTVTFDEVDIEDATADEVAAAIGGDGTILVDARPQEIYSGWALEGAANGGHLKGAKLFSKRWIDMEYGGEVPRADYLKRDMDEQGITADANVIVYDYTGEQAVTVAQYFASQGVANVKKFQAKELIDAGTDLESYENYRMFIPSEIVKSISDVKTGKETELTPEAQAVIGDRIDDVVLIDVGWGNFKSSTYFMLGHVPGAVHINSDSYERPRVYVPEKRDIYAKEWRKIPIEEFRDTVALEYGIDKNTIAILASPTPDCHGRLGLYLRALGVETYVMSGCLNAWNYNGYELDTAEDTRVIPTAKETFGSDEITKIEYDTEDVVKIMAGEMEGQIADERGDEGYNGEYSGYSYHDLAGRLEGSFNVPAHEPTNTFRNVDDTPRPKELTLAYMESKGLDTSIPMVFFCGDSWGASCIAYWCNSTDIENAKVWTQGWIPWSNEGHEFIDHNGDKLHYDKWLDTVLDAEGNDKRDGVNFLDDDLPQE